MVEDYRLGFNGRIASGDSKESDAGQKQYREERSNDASFSRLRSSDACRQWVPPAASNLVLK